MIIGRKIVVEVNTLGIAQHFLDGGVAGENAAQAVLTQRDHSELDRLLFQGDRRCALIDQFTKRIGDLQKLVNSFASFVAGVVASVAAFAVKEFFVANVAPRNPQLRQSRVTRLVSSAAMATDGAHQTLTKDSLQRRGNQEWFHAHVDQARNRSGRIVGVQGREKQMTGKRCLNGNLRGLKVARLAYHDPIRVLAKERSQNSRKRQAN